MHIHVPFIMYCSRLFVEINCLHTFKLIGSQGFSSLPSFMFVTAPISELCELNQNKKKKNSEIGYFQLENGFLHTFSVILHAIHTQDVST